MYKCVNSNLLYHGCILMTEDGEFDTVSIGDKTLSGKEYLDYIDTQVRRAYFAAPGSEEQRNASDFLWYLWCGPKSPLFGKSKMAAFERYFILEPETHTEARNPYYNLIEQRETCEKILREFGLDPAHSHIVNGHVPVKIRAGGKPHQSRRPAVYHRRRHFQSLSEADWHRRLYVDLQFPPSGAGAA